MCWWSAPALRAIASADGATVAYPARLEAYLRERLPNVAVTVTTNLQPKRSAEEVAEALPAIVSERKPDLVIWQTGTVDAIRAIHPDDFRNAVDEGITAVKHAGADAVLMNLQYSPRIETMLPTTPYLDNIRAVAQQQDVPLFDRYSIMQNWNETGVFDLSNSSRSFRARQERARLSRTRTGEPCGGCGQARCDGAQGPALMSQFISNRGAALVLALSLAAIAAAACRNGTAGAAEHRGGKSAGAKIARRARGRCGRKARRPRQARRRHLQAGAVLEQGRLPRRLAAACRKEAREQRGGDDRRVRIVVDCRATARRRRSSPIPTGSPTSCGGSILRPTSPCSTAASAARTRCR